jgi:hypothetical protein
MPLPLSPVDFAQAALIGGFGAVLWEELVLQSPTVLNEDTAYRFGFLFAAVLIVKLVLHRRANDREEASRSAASPKDSQS